jgi:tRNA-Thr(GGU) m(6)t(6)A37 methyltransferase TsaA
MKVTPFMDDVERGLFATRSPRRPNPVGISVVRLLSVHENILEIENVDMLDGTPLLDIKPYVSLFDHYDGERNGWLEEKIKK